MSDSGAAESSTYTARIQGPVSGLRVTVKDLIDMRGHRTLAGSAALGMTAPEATRDAACLDGFRAAEASGAATIVGRTVLDEFACGATGVNTAFGTPENPLDARRIPGGSSSGAAVSVAANEADVAIGTDTGGSVRIPAACCGIAGLKTTHGRISTRAVHPLSQTLDTVGVLARDIDDLEAGFGLLDPRFVPGPRQPGRISRVGRLVFDDEPNEIDAAIDDALLRAGLEVTSVPAEGWVEAHHAAFTILCAEGWANNAQTIRSAPELVTPEALATLGPGADLSEHDVAAAHEYRIRWTRRLGDHFARFDLLACPTLSVPPPLIGDADRIDWLRFSRTMPVNLAGLPALAMPLSPAIDGLPASLQLIAPPWQESLLLSAARHISRAGDR